MVAEAEDFEGKNRDKSRVLSSTTEFSQVYARHPPAIATDSW